MPGRRQRLSTRNPDPPGSPAPSRAAQRVLRGRRRLWEKRRSGSASPPKSPALHHHVYVVELDPAVARRREVRAANPQRNPALPCVYVGMTGLPPEERLANHLGGYKASAYVRRYGRRLLPELYKYLNPMPFEAACEMEVDLAEDLRRQGYTVTGGH